MSEEEEKGRRKSGVKISGGVVACFFFLCSSPKKCILFLAIFLPAALSCSVVVVAFRFPRRPPIAITNQLCHQVTHKSSHNPALYTVVVIILASISNDGKRR
jgi:hypothetical protein